MGMPSCCLAGIISGFHVKETNNELTKNIIDELCAKHEINVIYATDHAHSSFVPILLEIGFNIIDVNYNNNSDNIIYLLKYLYEK